MADSAPIAYLAHDPAQVRRARWRRGLRLAVMVGAIACAAFYGQRLVREELRFREQLKIVQKARGAGGTVGFELFRVVRDKSFVARKRGREALFELARGDDASAMMAAHLLAAEKVPGFDERLIAAWEGARESKRWYLAVHLGKHGSPRALKFLQERSEDDPAPDVRRECQEQATLLIGGGAAIKMLQSQFDRADSVTSKLRLAEELRALGSDACDNWLRDIAENYVNADSSEQWLIRHHAERALEIGRGKPVFQNRGP